MGHMCRCQFVNHAYVINSLVREWIPTIPSPCWEGYKLLLSRAVKGLACWRPMLLLMPLRTEGGVMGGSERRCGLAMSSSDIARPPNLQHRAQTGLHRQSAWSRADSCAYQAVQRPGRAH
eukprot:6177243-Pleurochrysis_carterae.AAC.3